MYSLSAGFQGKVDAAYEDGLNIAHMVAIQFPVLGWKCYATQQIVIAPNTYVAKLVGPPQVNKQASFSAQPDSWPVNMALTVEIFNTPEDSTGEMDATRIQDYALTYGILGARVDVGVVDTTISNVGYDDIKWDGSYRVDSWERTPNVVRLNLVDAMLHPGEKLVGVRVGAHFPNAPDSSKGQIIGPVFGHCEGVPLIPVEVGSEVTLRDAISETSTSATLEGTDWRNLGSWGYAYFENELVTYSTVTGGGLAAYCVLTLTRGGGGDRIPAAHSAGSQVHICPMFSGAMRYRYLIFQGTSWANRNDRWRAVSREGNEVFIDAPNVTGRVTALGNYFFVADWNSRIKLDGYSNSLSMFPDEWTSEVTTIDPATGYATPTGFARWRAGSAISSALTAQIPVALDRNASTQALYLKANDSASRTLHLIFDLNQAGNIATFIKKWGRFAEARLNLRIQYSERSDYRPTWTILHDNATVKTGTIEGPPDATTIETGDGTISGTATLPKGRWKGQPTEKQVKLGMRAHGYYMSGQYVTMIDPFATSFDPTGTISVNNILDGNDQTGLGGMEAPGVPVTLVSSSSSSPPAAVRETYSTIYNLAPLFTSATQKDKLTRMRLRLAQVLDENGDIYTDPPFQGFAVYVKIWAGENQTGKVLHQASYVCPYNQAYVWLDIPVTGMQTTKPMSVTITPTWFHGPVYTPGETYPYEWTGAVIGDIGLYITTDPWLEGQEVDTVVNGSSFFLTGTGGTGSVPSSVYDYSIPLTDIVNAWAADNAADPWEFFNDTADGGGNNGMGFKLHIGAVGTLQIAVGDIELELGYNAYQPEWGAQLLADVQGLTGNLIAGGTGLLENPADILAHLIDSTDFLGLSGFRSAALFQAMRTAVARYKFARCIREETTIQSLVASLCRECNHVLLFDGLTLYPKAITPTLSKAASVMTIGVQSDPALTVLSDDITIKQDAGQYYNKVSFGYRKNILTGEAGAIRENSVAAVHSALANRQAPHTMLEWQQSWRGYTSRTLQDSAVAVYATDQLTLVSTLWDYVEVPVYLAAGERLQRGDVVTFTYTRAGLLEVPARVVSTARDNSQVWRVGLQMSPLNSAYYWFYSARSSYPDYDTYPNVDYWLRYRLSLTELEIVIWGIHVATIDVYGNISVKGDVILTGYSGSGRVGTEGAPQHNAITADTSETDPKILFWLWRGEDSTYELVMALKKNGDLYLYGDRRTTNLRDWLTYGTYTKTDVGVHDTGDGKSVTGQLRFSTSSSVRLYVGSSINGEAHANNIGDLRVGKAQ